jgi:uncharacterized repeat protein (TIGR01451 family)
MSRKVIYVVIFFVVFASIILALDHPASASISKQNEIPPERVRFDLFAYHGKEEILLHDTQNLPELDARMINSPVDQWSKMIFESYINDNWEIYYANGDFTGLVRLTNNTSSDIHPRLNRGSTRIAFASYRDGTDYEIYTVNTDGTGLVRLTNNQFDDVKPTWSPDGTKIAFQSYRDGHAEVYIMQSDGSGQTRLTHSAYYSGEPSWSPDGRHIVFTSYRNSQWRVWVMDTKGANQVQLSQQPYSELPIWSPDGNHILYDADADYDDMQELWVMNADGSNQTMKVDGISGYGFGHTIWASGWSPDQSFMTYTDVELIYYQGSWYWDAAVLYKLDMDGISHIINQGRYFDWNLDWTTSDKLPPSTSMSAPPSPVPYRFTISWTGEDNKSGILDYDVQVRDSTSGGWVGWQSHTTETSALYTGIGGHTYYFRTRARDNAFNQQAWPNYQVSVFVEDDAPITEIDRLLPFTRGNQVYLYWLGFDPGQSGIYGYDIQYMDVSLGVWEPLYTNTTITNTVFIGDLGHSYHFRSRGIDNAMNTEAWPSGNGDTSTTLYAWLTSGTVQDNTGVPISGMEVTVDPPAFLDNPSDINGNYLSFLASDPDIKTINWSKPGYGSLPPTDYGLPDAVVDVCLPPADNLIQDSGFESGIIPGDWLPGGDFTPMITDTIYHSGDFAISLGIPQSLSEPITFDSGYLHSWSMTADKLGNIHLSWIIYGNMSYTALYTMQSPDGDWATTEQVMQFTAASTGGSEVAVDAAGNVHILILAYPNVFYTMRDIGGNWSAPVSILSTETASSFLGIEIDDTSTIRTIISTADHLYYAEHMDGGAWDIETVPNVIHKNNAVMAIGRLGETYLAWTSYNEEVYFIMRQPDSNWSDPVVFSRPGYAGSIDMVVDSKDRLFIVWSAFLPEGLYYITRETDGSWTNPVDISGGLGGFGIRLLIDQADRVYGLWSENYSSDEIVFSYIDLNGNWSKIENISHTDTPSAYVEAAISTNGDIFAVWWDYDNGYIIYYASRHAGVWSIPIRLNTPSSGSSFAKVIVDPMGGGHISWGAGNPYWLYYVGAAQNFQNGNSWLSQSLTIPPTMTNPTLSFMAFLSGISEHSGNEFQVLVSDALTTTTLFTSTTPTGWEHFWIDMNPWSGQPIILTFMVTENSGFPSASVLLDEVTLGAAQTDVWVDLTSDLAFAPPGEQFTFQLLYGNRSAIPASTSVITLSLPVGLNFISASLPPTVIGTQLVWHVDDLPSGSTFDPISIIVQADVSIPPVQDVITSVSITTLSPEIETMNNTSHCGTYLGYTDVWVELTSELAFVHPREQFTFQLSYGNLSAIPASTSVMTLSLPVELNFISASLLPTVIDNQLVWQMGDLPPGSTFDPILIIVQADVSIPLVQDVITSVSITTLSPEIETMNNTSHCNTYLVGYSGFLPIMLK